MRRRYYPFLSTLLFGVLYCYTAVGVFFVLILAAFGITRPVPYIIQGWARSVFFMMGKKIRVRGLENIRRGRKYILVANHASLFDIVAIVSFFPGISWFGHERLLRIPLFRMILRMIDYVPFREPNYRNTRRMVELLVSRSQQKTVAIFPEGTRTLNGEISTFYRGFIYLYRTSDLEILPVTLNGFYDLKPKNRSFINFSAKLGIIVHEPIERTLLDGKNDREILNCVRGKILSAYQKN